jgi:hypothetical protein
LTSHRYDPVAGGRLRLGGVVQTSLKGDYDKARRAAKLLRGEVIDLFAQVERAVAVVLAHAATLPEYHALKPAIPHLLGHKIERLRELMKKVGPLKVRASGVVPLVEKFASFENLRHFMAHGIVEVALKQSGEPIYEFRMLCSSDGISETVLYLTRPEAQSRTARLADTAIALASMLEAITDEMHNPPKSRG